MHVLRGADGGADAAFERPLGRDRSLRGTLRGDHRRPHRLFARAQAQLPRHTVWTIGCALPGRLRLADGISLDLQLHAAGVQVRLDGERFKRALVNLVDNAVEAMEEGEAPAPRRLTIATAGGEDPRIVIADSGPGIPPEVLPKVFDPLFSTKSFGTGLGLPTVRQVVEQHGGTIVLTSRPAKERGWRSACAPPRTRIRFVPAAGATARDKRA